MTIENCQAEGVKAKGVKTEGIKESANLPFHCQLSIVNCPLLKAIETARLKVLRIKELRESVSRVAVERITYQI
jgi:hypothetical protein